MNQLGLAFLTGLTTGGISCFAVQGGLLASAMTPTPDNTVGLGSKAKYQSVGMFIAAKILAYTLLGAALGLVGASLTISPQLQGWMQIFAGLFMLLTAARLLDLHPIFRYFVIQPPKFVFKLLRQKAATASLFSPAILGFLTVLIPCGITQGMMILAVASGNPLTGALILLAFTLGTSPVFFGLGVATLEILKRKSLAYLAALAIIVLGIISINTGQILRGSPHTLQNYWKVTFGAEAATAAEGFAKMGQDRKQHAIINITPRGYASETKFLKAGVPAQISLVTNNTNGCARAFTVPAYGIRKILPQTGTETVEFTPTQTGLLTYTCSMGMYSGSFTVIN